LVNLINTQLFVGNINDLSQVNDIDWAIVHATQTIHYNYFGWNRTTNKPDKKHPNYIYYEKENHLSLNWVDGAAHLYTWSGEKTFINIMDFIEKWISQRKVLVHCDQGFSRSPALCLLYLAKRLNRIPNKSYEEAKNAFLAIYPEYNPGGIGDYINQNWELIR
jgi:hypothetical protein